MQNGTLSPDGHAVAFVSPVGGIGQVFLMLTSGGEPLQLTNDEGDKIVDRFSSDGKEVYYRGLLAVRGLGRAYARRQSAAGGRCSRRAFPHQMEPFIYYGKFGEAGNLSCG